MRATEGRKKCLAAAYPEDGRVMRLRELANAIKSLPLSGLVERAADSLEKNGAKVLFASDAAEAREIILGILEAKGAKNVLKIKSMTTEEIGLNEFLGKRGIDAVETDLGELIIQLERERPSHIVKPAIHRTRRDIAKSFENHGIAEYDEDPQHITLAARKYLRKKYFSAWTPWCRAQTMRSRKRGLSCSQQTRATRAFQWRAQRRTSPSSDSRR